MFTVKRIALAFMILGLTSVAVEAAGLPCSKRGDLIDTLNSKYREQLSGYGVAGPSNIIEVFVSESGSWTILMSNTVGMSCIIAAGQSWEALAPKKNLTAL